MWLAKFRESGPGPDGRRYPKGSYVVFAEATSADPDNGYASATMHANVADVAGEILRMNEYLHVGNPTVHADAAVFANTGSLARSLGDEFKQFGLRIDAAPKPRLRVTLARLRQLIAGAGQEAVAGLYFVRRACPYVVTAFVQAVADERDIEVLDPRYALDHAIDAVKYGIESTSAQVRAKTSPMFPTTSDQALIDHVERQARAALRERQRWATKSPPPDMKVRTPMFDAAAIDRLNALARTPTDDKPKSPPLHQSPIVRTYK